ncbi:MAG: hypothetical protein ACREXV_19730 [Polaromonas sp.]
MDDIRNPFLITGAALSALAALMHLGCIIFGASWYRFFGAGERMAQLASAGSWRPTIITLAITAVLIVWSLYALSGAGLVPRLPFVRLALCVITGIYLLRGIAGLPFLPFATGLSASFWWWSSAICLTIGAVHLIGLRQVWTHL